MSRQKGENTFKKMNGQGGRDRANKAMESSLSSNLNATQLNSSNNPSNVNASSMGTTSTSAQIRGQTSATSGTKAMMANYKYIENYNFPNCNDSNKYEKITKIGQGTFGEVFKARERLSNKKCVAMKKILMENEKEGFPITALREIRILQLLRHENVINLIEICRTKATASNRYRTTFYLVFDFCEHDLAGLLSNHNVKFSLGEIKKVMQQLLNGLYYIHCNKVSS